MVSFAHLGLTCSDQRATERFYVKHFGFRRARVVDLGNDNSIVFLESGGTYLELFKAEIERPTPAPIADGPKHPGLRHIAFHVDDVDQKLADMGADARITLGPLRFDEFIRGWKSVWVADPDGNIIELSQGYTDEDHPAPPRAFGASVSTSNVAREDTR
jgi:glyoxylase I family protein